jgi:hypothetical protein
MQFGIRSSMLGAAVLTLVCGHAHGAVDIPIPGKLAIVSDGRLFRLLAKPVGAFTLPAGGGAGDPTANPSSLEVFDTEGPGLLHDDLTAGVWTGLGRPAGSRGYRYSNAGAPIGGAVRSIILKTAVIKVLARDDGTLDGPLSGNLGVELVTGDERRCADFGGTSVKNDPAVVKRTDAPAPDACPGPPGCPACNGDRFLAFSTTNTLGDCGDIVHASGALFADIRCAGLYSGGGGNSAPLPYALPDQGSFVTAITSCTGPVAAVGATSSSVTGSSLNCTDPGCLFGAPLAVPTPNSTPASVCVLNVFAAPPSGTVDCSTGATELNLPLAAHLFLTGDSLSTVVGIQPCPLCSGTTCIGGINDGAPCVPGTSSMGGNPAYPTSHDCPPDPMFSIGVVPIAFTLSSGTVTWTGTMATNDTGSTVSVQTRNFSGYCRDADGSGAFENPANDCWENGMAVGPACSGDFESCEQRNNGAFGPNGGGNRTIRAIGNATSLIGGPAPATLVGVFSIPPSFNATVDAAGDLPGPGAVALPGIARSCRTAPTCP